MTSAIVRADLLRETAAAVLRSARSARARRGWSTRRRNIRRMVGSALETAREVGLGWSLLPAQGDHKPGR